MRVVDAITHAGRDRGGRQAPRAHVGRRARVRDDGRRTAGRPAPRVPASAYVWRDLVPLLASRFRVIVPDLLGSATPIGRATRASISRPRPATSASCSTRSASTRFAVVGHARRRRGRAAARARRRRRRRDGPARRRSRSTRGRCPRRASSSDRRWISRSSCSSTRDPRGARAGMVDPRPARRRRSPSTSGRGRATTASRRSPVRPCHGRRGARGRSDLAKLDVPVLILWGEDDPFCPSRSPSGLNDAIPTSTLGLAARAAATSCWTTPFETIGPMIVEYLRARYLRRAARARRCLGHRDAPARAASAVVDLAPSRRTKTSGDDGPTSRRRDRTHEHARGCSCRGSGRTGATAPAPARRTSRSRSSWTSTSRSRWARTRSTAPPTTGASPTASAPSSSDGSFDLIESMAEAIAERGASRSTASCG